jgi:hypothetical protein
MSSSSSSSSTGISGLGLLGVVFVTLKLLGKTEVASWSWLWVTAPFWAGIALLLSIFVIGYAIAGAILLIDYFKK